MKNHHHHNPIHPVPVIVAAPSHESIAIRAHGLWEAQGRPEHHGEANWLAAERELIASPDTTQPNLALSTDS